MRSQAARQQWELRVRQFPDKTSGRIQRDGPFSVDQAGFALIRSMDNSVASSTTSSEPCEPTEVCHGAITRASEGGEDKVNACT